MGLGINGWKTFFYSVDADVVLSLVSAYYVMAFQLFIKSILKGFELVNQEEMTKG